MWRYSRCFAVNPNATTVGGDPAVADLGSVPGEQSTAGRSTAGLNATEVAMGSKFAMGAGASLAASGETLFRRHCPATISS
jgi:hypothetical protein